MLMTRRAKTIRICLATGIVFSLLLSPACFDYCALADADFISRDLKLEAFDQDLTAGSCDKFKVAGIAGSDYVVFLDTIDFKHLPVLSSQNSPFDQRTSVLRC